MPANGPGACQDCSDDLLRLLEQINRELLIELGKPVPGKSHLPDMRAGPCPATRNSLQLNRADCRQPR